MTTKTPPKHVLRGLLRRLKTPQLSPELLARREQAAGPPQRLNPSQAFVMEHFRGASKNDNAKLQLAQNYQRLLDDLAERARLYELDSGAEQVLTPAEQSRRAAARAGLQLPETPSDL